MIAGYLVGERQLLERLRTLPGAVDRGVAGSIMRLGIDLQRTLQQYTLAGRASTRRARRVMSKPDSRVEPGGASIRLDFNFAVQKDRVADAPNLRASLRGKREAFVSPIAAKAIGPLAGDASSGPPDPSFLRSALDSMTATVRGEVEATLAEVISQ